MLSLTHHQVALFERRMFDAMVLKVETAIARTFTPLQGDLEETAAPFGPHEIVDEFIEAALTADFHEAADIASYIALFASLRQHPPRHSPDWLHAWLERPDTPASSRLAIVEFRLDDAAADEPALKLAAKQMAAAARHCLP